MRLAPDVVLCVAGALLLAFGCSKKEAPPKGEQVPAASEGAPKKELPKASTGQPKGPVGSIEGKVSLQGEAPVMPPLKRGSDPACDKGEALAETIMVDDTGGLANVLIRIKPGTVPAWTPQKPIVIDQVDCMYRPRVQGGVRGQTVQVLNSDSTTHNVHARYLELGERKDTETLVNRAQPPGVEMSFELGDEPVAKLVCNYHAWMQGFVVVSDNPYSAVTESNGHYTLENVPAGQHVVELWHEFYGLKEALLTVESEETVSFNFSFDAELDNPRKKAAQ